MSLGAQNSYARTPLLDLEADRNRLDEAGLGGDVTKVTLEDLELCHTCSWAPPQSF